MNHDERRESDTHPLDAEISEYIDILKNVLRGLLDAVDAQFGAADPEEFLPGTTEYVLDVERIEARRLLEYHETRGD